MCRVYGSGHFFQSENNANGAISSKAWGSHKIYFQQTPGRGNSNSGARGFLTSTPTHFLFLELNRLNSLQSYTAVLQRRKRRLSGQNAAL